MQNKSKIIKDQDAVEFGKLVFSPTEAKKVVGTEFKILGFKQETRNVLDKETKQLVEKTVTKIAIEKNDGTKMGLATNSPSLADQMHEIFDLFSNELDNRGLIFKMSSVKVANGDMLKLDIVG